MSDTKIAEKVAPVTIPASRVSEVLAVNPGSRHFVPLGAIMAPPENGCAVARILAYVEKPKPVALPSDRDRVLNVDVTVAEDALLSFLRTGEIPEPIASDPRYRAQMIAMGASESDLDEQVADWENEMAKVSRKLKKFLRGVK